MPAPRRSRPRWKNPRLPSAGQCGTPPVDRCGLTLCPIVAKVRRFLFGQQFAHPSKSGAIGHRHRSLLQWHDRRADRRYRFRRRSTMVGRMHQPIPGQGEWLRGVVCGWFAYHAVPTNTRSLQTLRDCAILLWLRSLWRRGQATRPRGRRFTRLADAYLPKPRILHPWPQSHFAVKHPRWEPYAGMRTYGSVRARAVMRVPCTLQFVRRG